ncbi:uncharacterized protein CXQ87_002404 [Candidozyma duobushaemuli]|uniref:RHO1 GDP-GTP exchange protein 2 n=1 Tax=Candidozyma duobushaemuli TaxID=1231522 RepID=A0A2V1A9L9_9ASCO|nr:uncharacterized protein CXQ87_002404 [[Candida] duobushaemulonis]PVH14276.1 hypothetical protein CXQ87_002404 [[Candida] duobushaemulonis]
MSYGKGSARPDAMSLPEHLIPHGMLGQIGRSQRPPQELNNSQSYHETDSAPSHTEFVSSAADAAFDNSNKLSHSSSSLSYDRQQQQLPQGMVNQYPDTKSAGYNSRWAGPSTGKAPYPTSNNFSNPDSLNDAQHSQQIPYNGRYQPQYTAHQVNRPQYQGQRSMTSTSSNPYPAPYANSSAGQLPRQGSRGTLQSQNGSSLSLDTTGSIQNPPYGAGPPFGTVPEYGYAEHPTSMNSGVTGQHDMPHLNSAFKDSVILTINMKDGLEYHDSFTGDTAVDVICSIIRTNDRNLALLLGRSLDAQKFFHDVTYNHRLRDSSHEVYTFSRNYNDVEFFAEDGNGHGSNNNSNRGSFNEHQMSVSPQPPSSAPYPTSSAPPSIPPSPVDGGIAVFGQNHKPRELQESSGVNGVFTILSNCYSPTCTRDSLCYSIACPRRLEQQARLNMKPRGGLKRAVSRLSLHDNETNKTLWHETVDQSVLDDLDKHEKMRQELIYELIYTERDYVKDLEFMTDFYILPLRNPANNIIPEREREAFIRTVFGGVSELLRLGKSLSEALTNRQQQQKPVVESVGDVFLQFVGSFDPFIKYSGNKVFASFEHERQQQVNVKYARFLDAIEKKPESRKQDLSSFLIKGVQRPARYQLLLGGILKNTNESSPDYKNLVKAKEEIEKVLNKINIQTGESTDRHKIMVLHRLLGRQTLEDRFNFKLNYNNRIIYQVTLSRKRDNEKIDLYLFEHALLLVKHKIQNKREVHKVFEKPIYLPLLFVNSGYDSPGIKSILQFRENGSIVSDTSLRNRAEASNYNPVSSSQQKLQVNFLGLGNNPVHVSLYADDVTNQSQILSQVQQQQRKLLDKHDIFSLSKYETRRFTGHNRINCAVPCYGGKKLLYGTDAGVWVSTVRSISMTSNEKICSDPTMVISKPYISQMEVLVEYSKLLVLSEKTLYEFDLSCTDSLDHVKNTRSGKIILNYVSFFKTGVCDGRLLVCAVKSGSAKAISIVEPTNPFDPKMRGKGKKPEVREIAFMSEPVSISFLKTKLCIGCTKGFEILSLEAGRKEPILDEADPSLDFATQRESVAPLGIHRLGKNFLLSYSEFSFLINRNGWRTKHDWGIFWEGSPQNIALFYPYLLAFDPGFIEIRDLESTTLIRALIGENIRFLHSNEHEALYACEENGYDIIVSIDFLNLKPKQKS